MNVSVLSFLLGPSKVLGLEKLPSLAGFRGSGFLILRGGEPLIPAPGQQQAQGQHQNRTKWALPFPIQFILKKSHRQGLATTQ